MKLPLAATGRILRALLLSLTLAACSSLPYDTGVDFDADADFTRYQTWAWISDNPLIIANPGGVMAADNPLWERRIMVYIEESMLAKGLQRVEDPESADIALSFTLGARDKIRVDSYPAPYRGGYSRWGYGWGYGYPYGASEVDVREYTDGQLAIDIFDVEKRSPVFHGYATGNVRESRTQEEREALAEEIVNAILVGFPPQ